MLLDTHLLVRCIGYVQIPSKKLAPIRFISKGIVKIVVVGEIVQQICTPTGGVYDAWSKIYGVNIEHAHDCLVCSFTLED